MVDFRLYRLAFLPALVAMVVVLFSLEGVPDPVRAPVTLGGFDEDAAARTAREIATTAPERTPGSPGDSAAAGLVRERFGEIAAGEVSEQSFSTEFEGEDVEPRNVIVTLPGESERQLVVVAPRDSTRGPGFASSAAATGVLLELARTFGAASHDRTLVFVSTAGAGDGALGAREFAENYPERERVDAVVVVSQPGAAEPEPPFVIPWSAGRQSTAIQLTVTAADIVSAELGRSVGLEGTVGDLMRLAVPTGLGEQAPLIEDGIDAIGLSSAGERPLPADADGPDALSERTLAELGQAAQTLLLALDTDPQPPEHGPSTYVRFSDNLIPGWAIALLALTLLLPAASAAVDGFARALRRRKARPLDLGWVVGRSLPFLGALLLAYGAATVGLLPSPRFPYDPGRFAIGWRVVVPVLLLGAFAGAWWVTRPLRVPPRANPEGLAAATGVVASAAALGVWLLNPFLALLAVPAVHAWIPATISDPRRRLGGSAVAVAIAVVPGVAALAWLAGRLEVGVDAPWHLLLMLAGGQIGPGTALLGCLVAGCLVAVVAAGAGPSEGTHGRDRNRSHREPRISVRRSESASGSPAPGGPSAARTTAPRGRRAANEGWC